MQLSRNQMMRSIVIMTVLLISGSSLADTQQQIFFPGKRSSYASMGSVNPFLKTHPMGAETLSARELPPT